MNGARVNVFVCPYYLLCIRSKSIKIFNIHKFMLDVNVYREIERERLMVNIVERMTSYGFYSLNSSISALIHRL